MASPIRYRETFLRWHVARVLTSTDDVLALRELKRQAPGAALTLEQFFYGLPDLPQYYLPVRVRPLKDDDRELANSYLDGELARAAQRALPPEKWPACRPTLDLTYFLLALEQAGESGRGGMLLNARSGAGKTVACLASFCDCFLGPGPQGACTHADPRLAGWLPCRLPVDHPLDAYLSLRKKWNGAKTDEERESCLTEARKGADQTLIEQLLLAAAGENMARDSPVRDWLAAGPPLLLFIDLNAAGLLERELLAPALVEFQRAYQGARHRCVVAYRSATRDSVAITLEQSKLFHVCDLEPLSAEQAERYLIDFRWWQAYLEGKRVEREDLVEKMETELCELRRLIALYTRDGESLISTPLLMYLASVLTAEDLEKVKTLPDLYGRVVRKFFERDYEEAYPEILKPTSLTASDSGDPSERFLVAMCRVALAILACGAGKTRLEDQDGLKSDRVLWNLWSHPELDRLSKVGMRWHPAEDLPFWLAGRYYGTGNAYVFSPDEIDIFKKLTLLHRHADSRAYSFLHDSFVYYLAALAVRFWAKPVEADPSNTLEQGGVWYAAACRRLHTDPENWLEAADFLGGMLAPEELREFALSVLTAEPKDHCAALVQRLVRGRQQNGAADPVLAGIGRALRSKQPGVFTASTCSALFSEVYHHLRDAVSLGEADRAWVERLLQAMRATKQPWLHSLTPTEWQLVGRTSPGKVSVAVLDDRRVVAGGSDGKIVVWDQVAGTWEVLLHHTSKVEAVAVSKDGRVIVAGFHDGSVWRVVEGKPVREPLLWHEEPITSVAVDHDGKTVVSGDYGGQVHCAADKQSYPRPLLRHTARVTSVAVSGDGKIVVSGGCDGVVLQAVDGKVEEKPLLNHRPEWVMSVAVSDEGNTVISGGTDGLVLWAMDGKANEKPLLSHESDRQEDAITSLVRKMMSATGSELSHDNQVRAVAVSGGGTVVVSGDESGQVLRAVNGKAERKPLLLHQDEVRALAVSENGRVVVSGGMDGLVLRAVDGKAERDPLHRHEAQVTGVAVSRDGRIVASADRNGLLLRTVDCSHDSPTQARPKRFFTACAVSGDGRVLALGDRDGFVFRLVDGRLAGGALLKHKGEVKCLAVSDDGGVVVSGSDQGLYLWASQLTTGPRPLLTLIDNPKLQLVFGASVTSVAMSGDGRTVASGAWSGTLVQKIEDERSSPEPLLHVPFKPTHSVAISADGGMVVAGNGMGHVMQVMINQPDSPSVLALHEFGNTAVAVTGNGRGIVSGGSDGRVLVGVVGRPDLVGEPLLAHSGEVRAVSASRSVPVCVSGGNDATIRLWLRLSPYPIVFAVNAAVRSIALADNAPLVVTVLDDGNFLILDIEPYASIGQWD